MNVQFGARLDKIFSWIENCDTMATSQNLPTTHFEGTDYVDAAKLWRTLPVHMKSSNDRWSIRLKKLKICPQSCRFSPTGKISELAGSKAGQKSVYVPLHIWTSKTKVDDEQGAPDAPVPPADAPVPPADAPVPPADAQVQPPHAPAPPADAQTPPSTSTAPSNTSEPPVVMHECFLSNDEMFVFDNSTLNIRAYGEKTPERFFVNCVDVCKALGIVQARNFPDGITITPAVVDGVPTQTLGYDEMITLICLKANKSPVAKELRKWITAVIFSAQHGGGQDVPTQAQFASRDAPYRASTYFDDAHRQPVNYIIEICSATQFEEEHPGTALRLIPKGRSAHDFEACKIGCGDGKDRPGSVRRELMQLVPGSDPRPVAIERFPEASREELEGVYESEMHDEFEDQRVHGLKLNGKNYTEVFILDLRMLEHARKKLGRLADQHRRTQLEDARAETTHANERLAAIVADMSEVRSELKVRNETVRHLDETIRHRDETTRHLEAAVNDKTARTVQLERELASLKGALASALPKKCAHIMSGFLLGNAGA